MAETSTNDNIFSNLKSLIWSAFIGVVSFQILAPNIWDYLHSALGISYDNAYWWFTNTYFLLLPISFFICLWWNLKSIKTYLPPFSEEPHVKGLSKFFINALFISIGIQSFMTLVFFFSHVSDFGFTAILTIYLILNSFLLICCFSFCLGCIKQYVKKETSEEYSFGNSFHDFFAYVRESIKIKKDKKGKTENQKLKIEKKFFRSFIKFAAPAILILVILFGVGFIYLDNWEASKNESLSSKKAGDRGFALLYLAETIDSIQQNIAAVQDSLRSAKAANDLTNITGKDSSSGRKEIDSTLAAYGEYLVSELRKDLFTELNKISNIQEDSTGKDPVKISIDSSNDQLKRSKRLVIPDTMNDKDIAYLEMERGVFVELSKNVKEVAQTQLGLQLRSVQAKGMMLLLSLFFTILTLYIFLNTIKDIQNFRLNELGDANKSAEIEESVSKAGQLTGIFWIFLTVTAWLLIPIFKMVKDEDIDIKSPYKSVTFANPANDVSSALTGSKAKTSKGIDSSYLRIHRIDSVFIIDSAGKHDIEEIKKELESIHQKVNPIVND